MPTISQHESCNTESKCLYIIVVCRSPDTPAGIDRAKRYQPCLCLCLGFSQMIRILPLRLMTLHFSQIGFTDDLTFMAILLSLPLSTPYREHNTPSDKRPLSIISRCKMLCKHFFSIFGLMFSLIYLSRQYVPWKDHREKAPLSLYLPEGS